MKVTFVILLTILSSSFVFFKEDKRGLAEVERIDGKEIYLFSEPLLPYKVVEDYTNSTNLISSCNLENLVNSYLKRGKKDKVNFDALLMDGTKNIYLIKFIPPIPEE